MFSIGDLLISWWKCKQGIDSIDAESNPFVELLLKAFDKRGDELMSNPALSNAVYIDPRLHHRKSSSKLLNNMENSIEVVLSIEVLFLDEV